MQKPNNTASQTFKRKSLKKLSGQMLSLVIANENLLKKINTVIQNEQDIDILEDLQQKQKETLQCLEILVAGHEDMKENEDKFAEKYRQRFGIQVINVAQTNSNNINPNEELKVQNWQVKTKFEELLLENIKIDIAIAFPLPENVTKASLTKMKAEILQLIAEAKETDPTLVAVEQKFNDYLQKSQE